MKKINLFNKTISHLSPGYRFSPFHGKGVRRNRRGVWGITPSPLSPTKFLKFCGTRFGATPSWKEGERSGRGGLWFAAFIALFIATPSFAEPTELDKKTVASKAYVDMKQDIIETDQVVLREGLGGDPDVHVPALVSFGTPDDNNGTDGLLGNKVGILGVDTIDTMGLTLFDFSDNTEVMGLGNMDSFVPTVRVVANELSLVQGSILDILETVNAIYATLPTGTAGTVVTYNGTNAQTGVQEFGETPIYSGPTAQTPYNESTDATKLATAGFVETKQNKMVCTGWDSDTHTDEHCWLWSIE